jgi:hypothetical protein
MTMGQLHDSVADIGDFDRIRPEKAALVRLGLLDQIFGPHRDFDFVADSRVHRPHLTKARRAVESF